MKKNYRVKLIAGPIIYLGLANGENPQEVLNGWGDAYTSTHIESIQEVSEIPPAPPDYSTLTLTARQFFIMLANSGYVTPEEAVAAAQTGAVPANIAAVFATLPSEQALAAQITWAKMTTVARNEPLIAAVGASLSLTSQEIDQFFIDGQAI